MAASPKFGIHSADALVVTMAQLVKQLEAVVRDLPTDELPTLIGQLEGAKAAAWARLSTPTPAAHPEHDELLNASEASRRLGISKDYLYRHHAQYPFTRQQGRGRKLLFSALGIERHIRLLRP
jgi:hypothetical protein